MTPCLTLLSLMQDLKHLVVVIATYFVSVVVPNWNSPWWMCKMFFFTAIIHISELFVGMKSDGWVRESREYRLLNPPWIPPWPIQQQGPPPRSSPGPHLHLTDPFLFKPELGIFKTSPCVLVAFNLVLSFLILNLRNKKRFSGQCPSQVEGNFILETWW